MILRNLKSLIRRYPVAVVLNFTGLVAALLVAGLVIWTFSSINKESQDPFILKIYVSDVFSGDSEATMVSFSVFCKSATAVADLSSMVTQAS